jgi:hypothetical protein
MPKEYLHMGEVIEANTQQFKAQVLRSERGTEWGRVPALGALVRVDCQETGTQVLGVVCQVETTGIDSVHRPVALNLTREQLRQQQPQIFDLLRTDFLAVTAGFIEKNAYFQYFPPYPPQIHDFAFSCSDEELQRFTERLFCLRTLLANPAVNDEVVAAFLRHAQRCRTRDNAFLLRAGRELSSLLKDNYDRLSGILLRLQH